MQRIACWQKGIMCLTTVLQRKGALCLAVVLVTMLSMSGCIDAPNNVVQRSDSSVPIVIWTNNVSDIAYLKSKADVFNRTNKKNIQVEVDVKAENYGQAIEMADAQDKLPDILYGDMEDSSYYRFCRENFFLELSPYLTQELSDRLRNGIYPEIDGSIYQIKTGIGYGTLIYNKEIFARCGIAQPPKTLTEMVDMARQITYRLSSNKIYGFAQNMKDGEVALVASLMNGMARDHGVYEGFDYRKGRYDFTVYHGGLSSLKELLGEDCAMPGSEYLGMDALRDLFSRGRIAMYFANSSKEYRVYQELFPMKEDSYGQISIPRDNLAESEGVLPVNLSGGWLVSSRTDHLEESLMVLWELLYSVDYLEGYYKENNAQYLLESELEEREKQLLDSAMALPRAPHILNGKAITIQSSGIYEVIYSVVYGDVSVEWGLQKLTEVYNSGYSNAIKNGSTGRLYLPEYNPQKPELEKENYRQLVLPLYSWKSTH